MIPERYKINTTSFAHFWKSGVGKELLQKLPAKPKIEDAHSLIGYLFQYDEPADKLVRQLYLPQGFQEGHAVVMQYLNGEELNVARHTILLDQFFNSFEAVPDWVNFDRLNQGAELSQRGGLPALFVLRNYCLMGGYESAAINKPLIYTGALKKGAAKRLTDTVKFWIAVTRTDAFKNKGPGFQNVMSTRLIHSFSRLTILDKTDWDLQKWGVPLNTWDMLATHLGFSLVFLTGLRKMGFKPTHEEVDGLFHLWKYIGYLLGIPLQLLPENEEEAIIQLYYWTMTQAAADSDSLALAKALMDQPLSESYPAGPLVRRLMKGIHLYYNHYFLGDYSCSQLQLPSSRMGLLTKLGLWRVKRMESKMNNDLFRKKAIDSGAERQRNVLRVYLKYNKH